MTELLLWSAGILGLLAFFEPCTIATHTLFAVQIHKNPRRRFSSLVGILFSRIFLLVTVLLLAVWAVPDFHWMPTLPGIILLILAAVYIISRFTYLPIPHLSFYKVLPTSSKKSPGVQLGLTLPACTIPLFAVIIGLTLTVRSYPVAVIAGILFAIFFTLPTIIIMFRGVSSTGRVTLERSAKFTPFFTAFLFVSAALFTFLPFIDISLPHLRTVLREPTFAGLILGFIAGLIFSFNPVSFTSIPVMLAYVTKANKKQHAFFMGLSFVAGMILIHVVLGVAAALGGDWMSTVMGRFWGAILGPILILLGFMWTGWLKVRLPWFGVRGYHVTGLGGAFLLGIPFSIAVCPFCSPALLVMLTASATIGSISFGFFLLLSFALGRSIPVLIGAWSMGWLESLTFFVQHQKYFEITAGIIMIFSGLYLLNEYFLVISIP